MCETLIFYQPDSSHLRDGTADKFLTPRMHWQHELLPWRRRAAIQQPVDCHVPMRPASYLVPKV